MEEDLIKVVVFEHYNLISKIEEVQTVEIGDPNCKLVDPYTVKTDGTLEPFLVDLTRDKEIMIGSDKIITIVEPTATLIEKYKDLID
tara:strand:- start:777 stop:1037 length:261 start_codon:yes stop_codon:yes gene_type:complete